MHEKGFCDVFFFFRFRILSWHMRTMDLFFFVFYRKRVIFFCSLIFLDSGLVEWLKGFYFLFAGDSTEARLLGACVVSAVKHRALQSAVGAVGDDVFLCAAA